MATIEELQQKVQDYVDSGYAVDVAKAARQAQIATHDFIRRTHPSTAFGGKKINGYIIKGTFHAENRGVVVATIYANYFARWYNTGAFGRPIRGSGPRRGQKGPTYAPRGEYFAKNKQAIEEYFMSTLVHYLNENIGL